ncbi:hypothetical protein [Oscillatoria sp. HE19RPO]|uniref:hypothetical protein n=1 Tax=Oscillatoria sp. HE19RPO TaxID=2954806 RepID=UPI0020C3DEB4|nr:hypothetical protein [Oscillatoria sp. HE19RPO]
MRISFSFGLNQSGELPRLISNTVISSKLTPCCHSRVKPGIHLTRTNGFTGVDPDLIDISGDRANIH